MILSDVLSLLLLKPLLLHLLRNDFSSWCACDLFQLDWFEPAFRLNHLTLYLLDTLAVVIERECQS